MLLGNRVEPHYAARELDAALRRDPHAPDMLLATAIAHARFGDPKALDLLTKATMAAKASPRMRELAQKLRP